MSWVNSRKAWQTYAAIRNELGKESREAKRMKRLLKKDIPSWNEVFDDISSLPREKRKMALVKAKASSKSIYEKAKKYNFFLPEPEKFCGETVVWEPFRPYDEDYNSYDVRTERTIIRHKMTKEEAHNFEDQFWIHFVDPYCDGRDCTGAPFTAWFQFLRCEDRTIILHRINFDL